MPIGNSVTAATVDAAITFKLGINAKGIVSTAFASAMKAKDGNGKKLPLTGAFTFSNGSLSVTPAAATSSDPQPNLMIVLNHVFALGNNVVDTTGGNNVTFLRIKRGASASQYLIAKNNGPSTDALNLIGLHLPTGVTTNVYDGKTDITSQVYSANGYAVQSGGADLPSAGTKLFKMVIHVGKQASLTNIFSPDYIELKLRCTADTSNFTVAGGEVIVFK
ncbi:MAG: hypothetical protein QM796_10250 [Chthoniobacteraceae bacterium]